MDETFHASYEDRLTSARAQVFLDMERRAGAGREARLDKAELATKAALWALDDDDCRRLVVDLIQRRVHAAALEEDDRFELAREQVRVFAARRAADGGGDSVTDEDFVAAALLWTVALPGLGHLGLRGLDSVDYEGLYRRLSDA